MIASRRMLNMAGVTIRQFVPSGKITIDFDVINKTQDYEIYFLEEDKYKIPRKI